MVNGTNSARAESDDASKNRLAGEPASLSHFHSWFAPQGVPGGAPPPIGLGLSDATHCEQPIGFDAGRRQARVASAK